LHSSENVDRFPQWAPSGEFIAFQRESLRESGRHKHLYLVNPRTGASYDGSPSPDASYMFGSRCWLPGSDILLGLEHTSKRTTCVLIDMTNRQIICKVAAPEGVGTVVCDDGRIAVVVRKNALEILALPELTPQGRLPFPDGVMVRQKANEPEVVDGGAGAVYLGGSDRTIYRWTGVDGFRAVRRDDDLAAPAFQREAYTFLSRDGRTIPAQRLIPPNPKSLTIIYVFGGPTGPINLADPILLQLVSEGYEVICPAYRGKSGYGQEHEEANLGEYGRADVWDVIACAEDWQEQGNSNRPVVVVGFSYGGLLTLLSMAMAKAPWSGGISLWGVTAIEHMGLHVARAYPKASAQKRLAEQERSPIEKASRIRVPLLVLHGGRDTGSTNEEVVLIQQRMEASGTPCKLIIYDDDTHGLRRHRREMFEEIFRFLDTIATT